MAKDDDVAAETIGYWCRIRNIPLDDALRIERLGDRLDGPESQREFGKGWNQADKELFDERVEQLLGDLNI